MRILSILIGALSAHMALAADAAAAPGACDAKAKGHPAIKAFLGSGVVNEAIERQTARGRTLGCIDLLWVRQECGTAYCQSQFLVSRRLISGGGNVRFNAVTARVWVTDFGAKPSPAPKLVKVAPNDAMVVRNASDIQCPKGPGAETTAGIYKCRKQALDKETLRLERLLHRARRQMVKARGHALDPEWSRKRVAALGKSQAAWSQYSKAACDAVYHEHFPGSFARVHRVECLFAQTNARIQQIQGTYFPDQR